MKHPHISIITPCLNSAATIRTTIQSVIQQKIAVEYIIIDGGSTDGTLAIINEYTDKISHVISEPDNGISDAFNKGIRLANGEIIGILNSDDCYEPNALKTISDIFQTYSPEVVHGNLQYETPTGERFLEKPSPEKIWQLMTIYHPTMFVRKEIYDRIGAYKEDYLYAMDSEWVHRAHKMHVTFHYIDKTVTTMMLGGVSDRLRKHALNEFKKSTITHGTSQLTANYYYYRQRVIQALMSRPWLRRLNFLLRRQH